MDFLTTLPTWQLGLIIFFLRILDVSMGTVRTLAVVAGHIRISVVLGFLEVLIWVFAISQVIQTVAESPLVLFMYAGGFATGNAVGILVERRLAMGKRVVRLISQSRGSEIAAALRESGQPVTTFRGEGRDGERLMIYFLCERKGLPEIIAKAKDLDPELFYVIEPVSESRDIPTLPLPRATGWRSWMKQK